jgi:hypothetical protein
MKNTLFSSFIILLLCLLGTTPLDGQVNLNEDRFAFEPQLKYNNQIPAPNKVLGYELGETFTIYAHVVDYFKQLTAASPRITMVKYGETYEKRPLYYLVITSEENQSNIESIRKNNLDLANFVATNEIEFNRLAENHPVVVSYSYNIHGNEASSTEAAMQVAYRLAATNDAETKNLLKNTVFIMYPCINPDGRDRFVYWYNSVQRNIPATSTKELEHSSPWPNGRTNHYWFDLNRDWIWRIHPESRGHTDIYQQWMPQVHVDYHEQGHNNNYFTAPGTTPRNLLLPDNYEALSDTFGKANIEAFDKHQINYFTREAFDFFYPGYGSSYPSVMGAIGMLTEQGSSRGRAVETNDGYVLTFRQGIFDHYTTSIATLKKAAERREMLLRYSWDAANPGNTKDITKAYVFPDNPDSYLYEVLNILQKQGVKIDRSDAEFSVSLAENYQNKNLESRKFPKGTFIVKTDQPRHLFINSVLSPNMAIEDSVMYDMSTWAAPLAYNLDAYYSKSDIRVASVTVTELPTIKNGVINANAQYAYTIDWKQQNAPKALALLWEKGYRVRSAQETFSNGLKTWSEGTLIILQGRNREKKNIIEKDLAEIAKKANVLIEGHNTGRMLKGIDLASGKSKPVKKPKVALLVESPFSTYTCGQIYFLFDQITHLPVDRVRTSNLKQTAYPIFGSRNGAADLNDYEVVILPGGGNNLKKLFGKEQIKQLSDWVSAGGVLIATESASEFFTREKSKMTKVNLMEVKKDSSEAALYVPYKDRRDFNGKKRVPGAALNAVIDKTHPLAFGMPDHVFSLKFGNKALKPNPDFQTVGYYAKDVEALLASGYASEENLKHLAGKTFAGVQPMGRGKIVYLMDNTQYRMFWRGPSRMMQNAVMLLK